MPASKYKVDPRCKNNPDCLRLHVSGPEAVAALSSVFPAMAATGGYMDSEYPDGILNNDGSDVLDISGGVQYVGSYAGWAGTVWHENNDREFLIVEINPIVNFNIKDGGGQWARKVVTTVYSNTANVKKTYVRSMLGNVDRAPRINGRREAAKAVQTFLNEVTA